MSKFSYPLLVFTHSAILRENAEKGYSVDAVAPLKIFSFLSFQVDQRIEKGMGLQIIRSGFRTIERDPSLHKGSLGRTIRYHI